MKVKCSDCGKEIDEMDKIVVFRKTLSGTEEEIRCYECNEYEKEIKESDKRLKRR